MRELKRWELAVIKRSALNTKSLRDKKAKLIAKSKEIQEELEGIEASIEGFEAPIKLMTGGFTSSEVLEALKMSEEEKEAGSLSPESDLAPVMEVPATEEDNEGGFEEVI